MRPSDLAWGFFRLSRQLSGRPVGVLALWPLIDRLLVWVSRSRPVQPGGLFRYTIRRHRGEAVRLGDGTAVRPGDPVVELHLDNTVLLDRVGSTPWPALTAARRDLVELARLAEVGALDGVRALHGVSLLGPAGRQVGFEVRTLPRTWRWGVVRWYMAGLEAAYHPAGPSRLDSLRRRWPHEVWMSVRSITSSPSSAGGG